jgi:membrane protease YdiL (CAAX protease family)
LHSAQEEHQDVFASLSEPLWFYFLMLALLSVYKFTDVFPEGLQGQVIADVVVSALVVLFATLQRKELVALLSFRGVRFEILAITVVGALFLSIIVDAVANFINVSISDDIFYSTALFADTRYPLLFATLIIAVQPAIFEELAFRGMVFGALRNISKGGTALYVSSILFAIIHLQVISLLWLVPLGLALGYLREKYNTLWYGIAGHFAYNFALIYNEGIVV